MSFMNPLVPGKVSTSGEPGGPRFGRKQRSADAVGRNRTGRPKAINLRLQ